MTQEAIELKKLEHAEKLQDEKLKHDSREKRKDRIANAILGGFGGASKLVGSVAKAAASNDPSFYLNQEELKDICSLNTAVRTGADNLGDSGCMNAVLPGVCILQTVNVPPACGTVNDPVNSAFRAEYKIVRGRQYGDVAYSYADMAQMLICMADIYAAYYWLRRTYGLVTAYNIPENQYWTTAILKAEGWDVSALMGPNGRMQLFDVIDRLTKTMSAWVAPGGFNYFARSIVQYGGVYKDSLGDEGQYYMKSPYGFFVYDVANSRCNVTPINRNQITVTYVSTLIDSMIQSLYTIPSFNKMQSEMQMAYADTSWTVDVMSFDYSIVPVYDEYALSMFANATYPNDAAATVYGLNITQNTTTGLNFGAIIFKPGFSIPAASVSANPYRRALFRADADTRYLYLEGEVTPEKVVEAVQMSYFLGNESNTDEVYVRPILSNSCSLVMKAQVCTYQDGELTLYDLTRDAFANNGARCCWSAFAYAPVVHTEYSASSTNQYFTHAKPNKVTTLTAAKLKQITERSAFTLFSAKGSRVDNSQRRSSSTDK